VCVCQIAVTAGECIRLRCSHNDDTIWIESALVTSSETPPCHPTETVKDVLGVNVTNKPYLLTPVPSCCCGFHTLCSSSRLAMVAASDYVHVIDTLVESAAAASSDSVFVFADDPFLPLALFSKFRERLAVLSRFRIVSSYAEGSFSLIGFQRCFVDVLSSNIPAESVPSCRLFYDVLPLADFIALDNTSSKLLLFDPFFGLTSPSILCSGSWPGVRWYGLRLRVSLYSLCFHQPRRIPAWPLSTFWNPCQSSLLESPAIELRF
jgi:hypothetical protein